MIKFKPDMLRVEIYDMKSCTTALGGSMRIVKDGAEDEACTRIPVPLAVARQFKVRYKTSKYIKPVLVAAVYYGESIIALERHPLGCMGERFSESLDGTMKEWSPTVSRNIDNIIIPLTTGLAARHDWYFDGRYMFTVGAKLDEAIYKSKYLTKDGLFRIVEVQAIGLHELPGEDWKLEPATRTCMAFRARNGQYAISPPIWKDVSSVGKAKIAKSGYEGDNITERQLDFDKVDAACAVNISFALKAAAELSTHFGFEAIEPLDLPSLMIRLNTVNLPRVAPEVKATFDSGIKFTHALAWLLGYAQRAEDMETYAVIRSLLKYLTTKGMFFRKSFDGANIFKKGVTIESIPLRSKDEAIEAAKSMTLEETLEMIKNRMSHAGREGNVIGGVLAVDDDDGSSTVH